MKWFCTIFVVLTTIFSYAQNYQSIKSDQINYFGTVNLDYVLATRTDSVLLNGLDSVFYSFSTLRPNDNSSGFFCDYKRGAPWYGENVIIRSNGENCFINKDLDTITLNTQAVLNDTFLVYTYPNGNWVKGWVSSVYQDVYLSSLDSIKEFTLFSNDSTFLLEHTSLKIGKELGFVTIFPFYSFPEQYEVNYQIGKNINTEMRLVGMERPRVGITRRTVGEIFDFDIGDAVKWYENETDSWANIEYYSRRTIDITGRTQWGADSIEFDIEFGYFNKTINNNYYPPNLSEGYGFSSNSRKYYNLDSLLNNSLPEELYWSYSFGDYAEVYQTWMNVDYCSKIQEGYIQHGLEILLDSLEEPDSLNCIGQTYIEPEFWVKNYGEGIGGPYVVWGLSFVSYYSTHYGQVSYWGNSNEFCGSNWFIGASENDIQAFSLYPNPSNGFVTIQGASMANGFETLSVFNLSGKLVFTEELYSSITKLDLTGLKQGVYLITLSGEKGVHKTKLVIH